jgi:hypothetical protein
MTVRHATRVSVGKTPTRFGFSVRALSVPRPTNIKSLVNRGNVWCIRTGESPFGGKSSPPIQLAFLQDADGAPADREESGDTFSSMYGIHRVVNGESRTIMFAFRSKQHALFFSSVLTRHHVQHQHWPDRTLSTIIDHIGTQVPEAQYRNMLHVDMYPFHVLAQLAQKENWLIGVIDSFEDGKPVWSVFEVPSEIDAVRKNLSARFAAGGETP